MTTLLWVKGDGLYSDSRYLDVIDLDNDYVIENMDQKLFISEDKTFIYAVTGDFLLENKSHTELVISNWLNDVDNLGVTTTPVMGMDCDEGTRIFNGAAFIITTDKAWVIKAGEHKSVAIDLSTRNLDYMSVGSGKHTARAIMRLTANPLFAITEAINSDGLSGGKPQYISFNQLVPRENTEG